MQEEEGAVHKNMMGGLLLSYKAKAPHTPYKPWIMYDMFLVFYLFLSNCTVSCDTALSDHSCLGRASWHWPGTSVWSCPPQTQGQCPP